LGLVVVAVAWVQLDPFHVAERDGRRVYHQFTGRDPVAVTREGTYIGDELPTGVASGPLVGPTTIRAQMLDARAALLAAGYRPSSLSTLSRLWCTVDSWPFWRPEHAPATVRISCEVTGANDHGSTAAVALEEDIDPRRLSLSVTATGYQAVSADTAPDLTVTGGKIRVAVSQTL
jgi:hypothetical protein